MKGLTHKFLYLVAGLIVLVLIALTALSIWSTELTRFTFVPRGPLEAIAPLPANAYGRPEMWISRPGKADDPAQFLPSGAARSERGAAGRGPRAGRRAASSEENSARVRSAKGEAPMVNVEAGLLLCAAASARLAR